ncbi:MAG TPA: hypothetical protein PK313_00720, partial [Myxococcota bacterium]|nr:hypothetical protein [Myxococcota bacterium]
MSDPSRFLLRSGALALFTWTIALSSLASAQTWPTEAEWIPGENQGVPVGDPCKDQPAAVNARDVVGDDVI